MEERKSRLTVKILGEEYIIRGDTSSEHLEKVAGQVNDIMSQLAEKYPRMSNQKLAVLTALNLSDRMLKLEEEIISRPKAKKKKAR